MDWRVPDENQALIAFGVGLGIHPWIVMAGLVPAIYAAPPR